MPGDREIMRVDRPSLACRERIIYALKNVVLEILCGKRVMGCHCAISGKTKRFWG